MKPLYEMVKAALRQRIDSKQYRPGDKLPSEAQLVSEFRVSAITARRAVRDLIMEGIAIGRQGLGVYVAEQSRIVRSFGAEFVPSIGERMRLAGIEPSLQEVSISLQVPPSEISEALGLSSGTLAYRHEKLILANGKPVCVDITFLPEPVWKLLKEDLAGEFLLPLLVEHEIDVATINYQVHAAAVSEQDSRALDIPVGSPVLSVRYIPIDQSGSPIFVGQFVSPAQWFAYEFNIPSPNQLRRAASRS